MRTPKGLLFLTGCMGLFLVLYFNRFPIFPEFRSADFEQHLNWAMLTASGHPMSLSQQALYGGVEWWLAAFLVLLPGLPSIEAVRIGAAALVLLSVPVVWYAAKTLMGKAELITTGLYVFGGAVWFGYVFNSGLYANFFGMVAMLLFLTATVRFVGKPHTLPRLLFLIATLVLVLFGHYSDLLFLPAIYAGLAWVAMKKRDVRRPALVALGLMLSPLALIPLYPNLVSLLIGYVTSGPGQPPSLTYLSSLIPLPSLAYMMTETVPPDPFRFDAIGVAFFAFVAIFGYAALKRRDWRLSVVGLSFLTPLVAGNWGVAWRFAYVGLIPAVFMAGYGMDLALRAMVKRYDAGHILRTTFLSKRREGAFLMLVLLVLPTFTVSWGSASFWLSTSSDSGAYAASDRAVYQTIGWMAGHQLGCGYFLEANGTATLLTPDAASKYNASELAPRQCIYATSTDWRFEFSKFFGPPTWLLTPLFDNPDSVLLSTETVHADYLIVTNAQTMYGIYPPGSIDPFQCGNPGGDIISIGVPGNPVGGNLTLGVEMEPQITGYVSVYLDGQRFGSIHLVNGSATVTVTQLSEAKHDIQVKFNIGGAFVNSNIVTVFGNGSKPVDHGQYGYCSPWWFQESDLGKGSHIVYEIPNEIKVWCISLYCAKS